MDDLRRQFQSLGFHGVATFLASGNVVFEAPAGDAKPLERKIEKKLRKALGSEAAVFLRTVAELNEVASFKPFRQSRFGGGAGLDILFLAEALDKETKTRVAGLATETDEFRVRGREIYWLRRRKPGTAAFATVPLEKTLRRPFTIRGANTVRRLVERYGRGGSR